MNTSTAHILTGQSSLVARLASELDLAADQDQVLDSLDSANYLLHEVEILVHQLTVAARADGATLQAIADVLGTTRQAVHQQLS